MTGLRFSIGYNWDLAGFCDLLSEQVERIASVYLPIPARLMGSGRPYRGAGSYEVDIVTLLRHCRSSGIPANLLLNSASFQYSRIDEVVDYVSDLRARHGLDSVTVTDPYVIKVFRERIPDLAVEVSIVAAVRTAEEARCYRELGAVGVTVDNDVIRDLGRLEEIGRWLRVKVLLNSACLKGCVFKRAHYLLVGEPQLESMLKGRALTELHRMCLITMIQRPHRIFAAPFVRPEDLHHYLGRGFAFKLSTRESSTEKIRLFLQAYGAMRYDGDLLDLLISTSKDCVFESLDNKELDRVDFFRTVSACDDDCDACGFCPGLLERAARFNATPDCRTCRVHDVGAFLGHRGPGSDSCHRNRCRPRD